MDNGLVLKVMKSIKVNLRVVLILVVVDNGLVPRTINASKTIEGGLNPCCSGQWSSTDRTLSAYTQFSV